MTGIATAAVQYFCTFSLRRFWTEPLTSAPPLDRWLPSMDGERSQAVASRFYRTIKHCSALYERSLSPATRLRRTDQHSSGFAIGSSVKIFLFHHEFIRFPEFTYGGMVLRTFFQTCAVSDPSTSYSGDVAGYCEVRNLHPFMLPAELPPPVLPTFSLPPRSSSTSRRQQEITSTRRRPPILRAVSISLAHSLSSVSSTRSSRTQSRLTA